MLIGLAIHGSQPGGALTPATAGELWEQTQASPNASAVLAANSFLESLEGSQRKQAVYDFGSGRKSKWSNLPVTMVPRNGVKLGDLTRDQQQKAMRVVASVLSKKGFQKVVNIMDADQQLALGKGGKGGGKGGRGGKGGKGGGAMFGSALYYLAIFGQPSDTKPWMVQFGGHHLGINVTVIGKHFVLTPTHTGAQPAKFMRGDKEVRPLGEEAASGFKLMKSLDENQKKQAVIGERSQDLLLGPGRDDRTIPVKGIKGSELSDDQRALLLEVIGAWVNIVEADAAAARMAAIKDKIGETYFAWSGPTTSEGAAYFRIQGPAIIIEYAPQGSTDHIHTVIRNPENEYGAALMKQ
jgi:hypothetical protein